MSKRMLVDASHPEETRVVILSGNRVEEFDFESVSRKPLKGNIFLAKVTRVEPSLQAAFVEYGGNRHGFLAFSEIHPDYYQIPVADRQALLAAHKAEERSRREREETHAEAPAEAAAPEAEDAASPVEAQADEAHGAEAATAENAGDADGESQIVEVAAEPVEAEIISSGEDDSFDEDDARRANQRLMRHYKIQEVIKKRQILLIQVVKEERGNKGAALTTYLSLAGRYCVLMPNSGRGGGISRKITNAADRRRLKDAAESLDVPDGMGLIVRTAGASRTKQEIQRDYEYLLRLWDSIRDLTLRSTAPALVYEEGNLIKRAIRDQFSRDVEEIVVEGENGFREAQSFMRMIMPQQGDAVKLYDGRPPLFQRYKVENQLDSMFNPRVQLKSGGYLIINQTEALVSIDVNSGRSTREHNIEDTALKTNLEAAEEVARQLRLRDLAGLIVIDFIDMEENRNDRAVERRLKECLRHDRARIQIGRISPFGLLEMSRQRLRPGMVEGSTVACPHCNGTGLIRSVESLALRALRNVEEEAAQSRGEGVTVRLPTEVAIYVLNHKRADVAAMEERLGQSIFVEARHDLLGADCEVQIGLPEGFRPYRPALSSAISAETALAMMPEAPTYTADPEDLPPDHMNEIEVLEDEDAPRGRERGRRGRRRGRERNRDERRPEEADQNADPMPVIADGEAEEGQTDDDTDESAEAVAARESSRDGNDRRRRRRGRRGGRRNGRGLPLENGAENEAGDDEAQAEGDEAPASEATADEDAAATPAPAEAPAAALSKTERKSPAAAIARFFGFGKPEAPRAEAPLTPAAPEPVAEAAAPALAAEAEPAPAAPAEPAASEAAPEAAAPARKPRGEKAAAKPRAPRKPRRAATADPAPEATDAPAAAEPAAASVEAPSTPVEEPAMPQPAPAGLTTPEVPEAAAPHVEPGPAQSDDAPTTPYVAEAEPAPAVEEAAPAEPEARAPLVAPEVEASDVVVIGPAADGPPKAGWWKKREN